MAALQRLGALLAIVALALSPAVRIACLAMCASPGGSDATPSVAAAAGHGVTSDRLADHEHHHPTPAVPVSSATASAGAGDARWQPARGAGCAEASGEVVLLAGRAAGSDLATVPTAGPGAVADIGPPIGGIRPRITPPPPGPPPASLPLRI